MGLGALGSFFPHLVAGPILKPSHFLPQLQQEVRIRWSNVEPGVQIFLLGLLKKLVIADNMAAFVDPVFADPAHYDVLTIWLAVIAYAIQIYGDFSGYSDMAIGSAKILGFDIPRNFSLPYMSRSITEFWRRWHISLSTWLKEYLYISLGGNRHGKWRQHTNLLITMLLGGLWYGASWNFVVWGGLHGGGLILHKAFERWATSKHLPRWRILEPINWAITFLFVCVAWVFFRAKDFDISWLIIRKMFGIVDSAGVQWVASSLLWGVPVLVVFHVLARRHDEYMSFRLGSFRGALVVSFLLLALLYLAPVASSPFIYFQF